MNLAEAGKLLKFTRELPEDKKAFLIRECGLSQEDLDAQYYTMLLTLAWYIAEENPCQQWGDVMETLILGQQIEFTTSPILQLVKS